MGLEEDVLGLDLAFHLLETTQEFLTVDLGRVCSAARCCTLIWSATSRIRIVQLLADELVDEVVITALFNA